MCLKYLFLRMYSSIAFQLEYKTMMAKIAVGEEFTEITGRKWMNRRLAILLNTDRSRICRAADAVKWDNNGAPMLVQPGAPDGDVWMRNATAVGEILF